MATTNPFVPDLTNPNDPKDPLKLTQRPEVQSLLNPAGEPPSIFSPSQTPSGTPPVVPTGTVTLPGTVPPVVTPTGTPSPTGTSPLGLIDSTSQAPLPPPSSIPPVAGYTPVAGAVAPASSQGYTPTPYTVPEQGTVQKQIMDIVAADSPLMQQARQNAIQQMQQRGLLNSSIAVGAGEQAVISQALPIATSDAAAYNAAMTNTVNAQNAASAFEATSANAVQTLNAQLATQMNATNANAANVALSQETQAQNNRSLTLIDNNTKQALAILGNQNQQLLQTNVNAANMFSQTVNAIANISVNPNLDGRAKANAIQSQINLLNEGLKTTNRIASTDQAAVTALDLSQFFSGGLVAAPPESPTVTPTQAPTPTGLAGQVVDQNAVTQVGPVNGVLYGVMPDGKAVRLDETNGWVYV